ncbi:MAG: DsbA family protein [Woeseiaceae bacterium]
MSLRKQLRAEFLRFYLGSHYTAIRRALAETGRRIARQPHTVHAFLQLDDPYSYLLGHYLPQLAAGFDVRLDVRLAQRLGDQYTPQPAMLAEYAVQDCRLIARELDLPFLDRGTAPVVEQRRALLDTLTREYLSGNFPQLLRQALAAYWRGDSEAAARLAGRHGDGDPATTALLEANRDLLARLGHYNCATLYYGGEWYWGIDRLHYLVERLEGLGALRDAGAARGLASIRQAMRLNLPGAVPDRARTLPPLEYFHSFRSPYSYLALPRAFRIADAFGLKLVVRPVLPMVMRGLPVPKAKLRYIAMDAKREADRLGIPFGRIADPLGRGVERCIATFYYAREEHREREFLLAAGSAIWSEGIDVGTDEGLRAVTERAGLFWPGVKSALAETDWREACDANREDMTNAGVWGVPVFRIGELALWGQDRDWLVARQIEDLCHGGEGILI